jgi:uncharacterized protein (TIGR00369 family)
MLYQAGGLRRALCSGPRRKVGSTGGEEPEESAELGHGSPFAEQAGLKLVAFEEGRATVTLPLKASSLTPSGAIHRAAITVLVEAAAMAAALGPGANPSGDESTGELHVSFVRSAPEHPLSADARVVSKAGTRRHCEVEVRDWNGELVAKGFLSCNL